MGSDGYYRSAIKASKKPLFKFKKKRVSKRRSNNKCPNYITKPIEESWHVDKSIKPLGLEEEIEVLQFHNKHERRDSELAIFLFCIAALALIGVICIPFHGWEMTSILLFCLFLASLSFGIFGIHGVIQTRKELEDALKRKDSLKRKEQEDKEKERTMKIKTGEQLMPMKLEDKEIARVNSERSHNHLKNGIEQYLNQILAPSIAYGFMYNEAFEAYDFYTDVLLENLEIIEQAINEKFNIDIALYRTTENPQNWKYSYCIDYKTSRFSPYSNKCDF